MAYREFARAIIANDWDETEELKELSTHCMIMLAPGVWYHARLDMIIVIQKNLAKGLAAYIAR